MEQHVVENPTQTIQTSSSEMDGSTTSVTLQDQTTSQKTLMKLETFEPVKTPVSKPNCHNKYTTLRKPFVPLVSYDLDDDDDDEDEEDEDEEEEASLKTSASPAPINIQEMNNSGVLQPLLADQDQANSGVKEESASITTENTNEVVRSAEESTMKVDHYEDCTANGECVSGSPKAVPPMSEKNGSITMQNTEAVQNIEDSTMAVDHQDSSPHEQCSSKSPKDLPQLSEESGFSTMQNTEVAKSVEDSNMKVDHQDSTPHEQCSSKSQKDIPQTSEESESSTMQNIEVAPSMEDSNMKVDHQDSTSHEQCSSKAPKDIPQTSEENGSSTMQNTEVVQNIEDSTMAVDHQDSTPYEQCSSKSQKDIPQTSEKNGSGTMQNIEVAKSVEDSSMEVDHLDNKPHEQCSSKSSKDIPQTSEENGSSTMQNREVAQCMEDSNMAVDHLDSTPHEQCSSKSQKDKPQIINGDFSSTAHLVLNEQKDNTEDLAKDSTVATVAMVPIGGTMEYRGDAADNDPRHSDTSCSSTSSDDDSSDVEIHVLSSDVHSGEDEPRKRSKKKSQRFMITKGEVLLWDLPPIEDLAITVDENVEMVQVGKVLNVVDALVIVQALSGQRALDMSTILFLDERKVLGQVFETFGPVCKPLYSVRYNSHDQIVQRGIKPGLHVFYAPDAPEFTNYVFIEHLKQLKGSDASWENNNEPPQRFLDYSDDEEERRAKSKSKAKKQHPDKSDVEPNIKKRNTWNGEETSEYGDIYAEMLMGTGKNEKGSWPPKTHSQLPSKPACGILSKDNPGFRWRPRSYWPPRNPSPRDGRPNGARPRGFQAPPPRQSPNRNQSAWGVSSNTNGPPYSSQHSYTQPPSHRPPGSFRYQPPPMTQPQPAPQSPASYLPPPPPQGTQVGPQPGPPGKLPATYPPPPPPGPCLDPPGTGPQGALSPCSSYGSFASPSIPPPPPPSQFQGPPPSRFQTPPPTSMMGQGGTGKVEDPRSGQSYSPWSQNGSNAGQPVFGKHTMPPPSFSSPPPVSPASTSQWPTMDTRFMPTGPSQLNGHPSCPRGSNVTGTPESPSNPQTGGFLLSGPPGNSQPPPRVPTGVPPPGEPTFNGVPPFGSYGSAPAAQGPFTSGHVFGGAPGNLNVQNSQNGSVSNSPYALYPSSNWGHTG